MRSWQTHRALVTCFFPFNPNGVMDLERARRALWVYRSEFIPDRLLSTPNEATDLNAVYNGNVDDGEWKLADLDFSPQGV